MRIHTYKEIVLNDNYVMNSHVHIHGGRLGLRGGDVYRDVDRQFDVPMFLPSWNEARL